jgi:5-methylcytosine-specific restriction endonuclease McrA
LVCSTRHKRIQADNKGRKTNNRLQIVANDWHYQDWRQKVYERDKYTCQYCGDNSGGNLNAHHLKNFHDYPQLRFVISNGITLCKTCHINEHIKFGYRKYERAKEKTFSDTSTQWQPLKVA